MKQAEVFDKVGFGGGCHWCTEAIFQSLIGVQKVEQGWIASSKPNHNFSEAVVVHFDPKQIDLPTLIEIHLRTHSSTIKHSMRTKYRSAIYTFGIAQLQQAKTILKALNLIFEAKIITKVLPFLTFRLNEEKYLDYFYNNPERPFCQTYISPKLRLLQKRFGKRMKNDSNNMGADEVKPQ